MAEAFATTGDLSARWPSYPTNQGTYATTLLEDASAMVRERWPDIDTRIAAGTLQAASVKRVVCQMVRRAMLNDATEGVESLAVSSGTLAETRKYTNPDGNLYLTRAEARILDGGTAGRKAFAVDLSPGVRPDWL